MKSYAEFETDKFILEKYFHDKTIGIMVEVGAAGPEHISTSKLFKDVGWRCLCVEPNPKFADQHRKIGNEIYEVALSDKSGENIEFNIITSPDGQHTGEALSALAQRAPVRMINPTWVPWIKKISVKVMTLNELLEQAGVSKLDFVSIDVEGWELDVLRGFNAKKYSPKIILLENLDMSPVYHNYMKSIGYTLDHSLQQNEIYLRKND